jgi:L-amino acid N-acyltransferase
MTQREVRIREATSADVAAITEIINEVIAHTTAIWRDTPVTVPERQAWFDDRIINGYPVIVSDTGDGTDVTGFASYAEFRSQPGYRETVEHSIHLRADQRGNGIGTMLMRRLLEIAKAQRRHLMVAGIDGENIGSIRFHARFGFVEVARMPECGRKFGRLVDLVLMQRLVANGSTE